MTGRQKIFQVLEHIRKESQISPNHNLVKFKFNKNVVSGVLDADEEKIILKKLEKEGVVKINNDDDYYEIVIKIQPSFYRKYFLYRLTSLDNNAWNILNPFWILWQLIVVSVYFINWLWNKNKVITFIIGLVGGLLTYDWLVAWKNLKLILIFLKLL